MKHSCKYCGKSFDRGVQLGGHSVFCKENPNRNKSIQNISITNISKKKRILECEKCSNTYEVFVTDYLFLRGKYKKHCSRSCANVRKHTNETKRKIAKTLSDTNRVYYNPEVRMCVICNSSFSIFPPTRTTKTCSNECKNKLISKNVRGKTGGYRRNGGNCRGEWYNDIWMHSTWEVEFAKRLDKIGVKWERGSHLKIKYMDADGICRIYYPDFFLPARNRYVEIKGYWTDESVFKMDKISNKVDIDILESLDEIFQYK